MRRLLGGRAKSAATALSRKYDVWQEEGVKVALVPHRTALAGPIFAAGVVVAARAVNIAKVNVGPK